MTIDLDRWRRRLPALALLVVVVLVAVNAVIVPVVVHFRSAATERSRSLHELAKLEALVDAAPALKGIVAKIDAHPLWQRLYPVDNGSAMLQQDFRGLVEAQGITLDSIQPLEPASGADFRKLTVRVAFSTTVDHLSRLELAMRAAPHLLRFDELNIASPASQTGGTNPVLVIRADVAGYSPVEAP